MGRTSGPLLARGYRHPRLTGLYERDAASVAGLQKLRFFPQAVTGGRGATLRAEDGRKLIDLQLSRGAASLGAGLPLLAVAGPAEVMDCATAFAMQTLHGNPICAAAGLAMPDTFCAEKLADEAARKGTWLMVRLQDLAQRHPILGAVRGPGLAMRVEICCAGTAAVADQTAAACLMLRAHDLGLVFYCVGPSSNVLEFTPPLTICDGVPPGCDCDGGQFATMALFLRALAFATDPAPRLRREPGWLPDLWRLRRSGTDHPPTRRGRTPQG